MLCPNVDPKGTSLKIARYCSALLGLLCCTLVHADVLNIAPESVDAEAWLILDTHSGQVIAQHRADVQRAPASLTKMMVAYIALKEIQAGRLSLNEVITASNVVQQVKTDESRMKIKPGDTITVDQLLAGLVIMSANDGALLLAERISGDVPKFVARMNQEAKVLGMQQTHFQNPPGITMPEHYSTAYDLALLAHALVTQTPQYLTYSKQPQFSYQQIVHQATNLLLARDASVDGLKTGYTAAAGYNLALTAQRRQNAGFFPQRRLIVVVLGAQSIQKRAEVAQRLLNLTYTYTRNDLPILPDQAIADIPVQDANHRWFRVKVKQKQAVTVSLYPQSHAIHLKNYDQTRQRVIEKPNGQPEQVIEPLKQVNTQLSVLLAQPNLNAPIHGKMNLAQVSIYQDERLLRQFEVANQVELSSVGLMQRGLNWLSELFSNSSAQAKILIK